MNLHSRILLAVLFWFGVSGSVAQELGLEFSANPEPVLVGTRVAFTLSVTNRTGADLAGFSVLVELNGDLVLASSSTTLGTATNGTFYALYQFPSFTNLARATLTYGGVPTAHGVVTHTVNAGLSGIIVEVGKYTSTNISGTAALVLTMGPLPGGIVVNDRVEYSIAITNSGPDIAESVILTNTMPAGVSFLQVNPAGVFGSMSGNEVRFRLGNLASGAGTRVGVAVQPRAAETFALWANVGAAGYANPSPSRAIGVASFAASSPTPATLQATLLSAQVFNRQTGLLEQRVSLVNEGTNAVTAARVIVAGLTNRVFNATGTNQNTPYAGYPASLAPGESVEFVLEYFSPSRQPGPDPVLSAMAVPVPSVPTPRGTPVSGTQALAWGADGVLLQFPAVEGQHYVIRYASTLAFTNAWTVQPDLVAPGSRVQWLDQGPPYTLSPPGSAGVRFYRVHPIITP